MRRYYLDARQLQPSVEAEKAAAEKEAAPEKRAPQPVDAEALLREAEEQAGDQVRVFSHFWFGTSPTAPVVAAVLTRCAASRPSCWTRAA